MRPEIDALGIPTGRMVEVSGAAATPLSERAIAAASALDNGVRMLANGLTFGMADRVAGAADAATGQADSYDEGVTAQRARTQAFRDEAPIAAGIAEAVGGLVGGVGLMRNGMTMAGRLGPSFLGRTAGYGLEGAAYGVAHGAGNTYSDNAADYGANAWEGAKLGGMVGIALPAAGAAAGGAYRAGRAAFGPRVENTGRGASALMRGAAQADAAGLRALPAMGDDAMLVDAGPSMLGLGQGAATGIGPGRTQLVDALRQRDAGTAARLARTLDATVGPAPIPSRVEAGIAADRSALSPAYQAALRDARAVDTQALAETLEASAVNLRGPARSAAEDVRRLLNIYGTDVLDPNPASLLETRKAIDGMMNGATDGNVRRVLGDARRMVDEELAAKVPGIKQVDAQYAELARQSSALERGQTVFDTGRASAVRPPELADELAASVQPQGTMVGPSAAPYRMRQGARAEVDRIVGTQANDLNALERTLATPQDWNSQKYAALFGDQNRQALADALATNRTFRNSYQAIAQGSQTAQRTAAARAMEGRDGPPIDTTLTGAGLTIARLLMQGLASASRDGTKDDIARLLAQPATRRIVEDLLRQAGAANQNAAAVSRAIANPAYLGGASAPAGGR